jgi:hypothetical protein
MPKQLPIFLSFLFLALTVSGCASSKDVKLRAYLENKPRLDQEVTGKLGNKSTCDQQGSSTRSSFVSPAPRSTSVEAKRL